VAVISSPSVEKTLNTSTLSTPAGGPVPPGTLAFEGFLDRYQSKLRELFREKGDIDKLSLSRSLPPHVMEGIRSCDPFSVYIPKEFGGRGGHIPEGLAVLAASGYESLALSLTLGINWALFLQPIAKYGQDPVKGPVFNGILKEKKMGGLMITEPDHGTDALNMQTFFDREGGHYHIQGVKHWGGLTGMAGYWLLTARERGADGKLKRDIDFFLCDVNAPGQSIEVEEIFNNLGLYHIPYGRNILDVRVPEVQRLQPPTTGVKMMLDLLHRSRLQFSGLGMGFLQRMLDEALAHCKQRFVGGRSLFSFDQVQHRLAKLQASFTVCSAFCASSSQRASVENDLSKSGIEANSTKAIVTDMMQDASQSLLQLVGAKGYRLDHIAGRSTVDSRPFQIFEGSNDILYQQIAEAVLKLMRSARETNLLRFLKTFELTSRATGYVHHLLDFEVDLRIPQRKMVELGQALGRTVSMEMVLRLGDQGFREDLINNGVAMLRHEITTLLSGYQGENCVQAVEDYEAGGSWLALVTPARP
jgi:alkylation response protein AidB-like acyl-CoA dehydrogenase